MVLGGFLTEFLGEIWFGDGTGWGVGEDEVRGEYVSW